MILLSALLLSAAAQTATATAMPAMASAKPTCRRAIATGSIMPGKRTCHTPAEWKQIDDANAKAVDGFRDSSNGRGGVGSN